MDGDHGSIGGINGADFEHVACPGRADVHGETVVVVGSTDGIAIRVEDVSVIEVVPLLMFAGASGDDRLHFPMVER